jgi:hypothetical protein
MNRNADPHRGRKSQSYNVAGMKDDRIQLGYASPQPATPPPTDGRVLYLILGFFQIAVTGLMMVGAIEGSFVRSRPMLHPVIGLVLLGSVFAGPVVVTLVQAAHRPRGSQPRSAR